MFKIPACSCGSRWSSRFSVSGWAGWLVTVLRCVQRHASKPQIANLKSKIFTAVILLTASSAWPAEPLARAHAHNDYLHARPLFDALEQGFCSVEADVFLVDGQLLVAHDFEKIRPGKRLRTFYLEPLAQRARLNGGSVFTNGPAFTLLIDFKSEANATYVVLREQLKPFADVLTKFSDGAIQTNAITIVLSGNRPIAQVAAERERYVAIDGRLPDLETNAPPSLVPLISDNWTKHFQWRGVGPLAITEKERLRQIVTKAHQQGRRIRFWAAPDHEDAWLELHDAGVDFINTDQLAGLAEFLRKQK